MKTKTFFKWLCCSAILLIASAQPSWAGYRKGNIVFDASGWGDPSYVYFCIVRETGNWYTETKQINKISNTHLYYAWTSNGDNWWDSPTYWAFIGQNSSFGSGSWGYSNLQNATHYTGKYTIGSYNIDNNNLYYFSKSGSNNGASIDVTYYDNPSKLNKEVKVGSKVKLAGGSYTDQVGSVAKVYAKYYEFPSDKYAVNNKYSSDYKTVSKGTKGTESIYSALTSDVNFSYSDLASGYKFDGWYNGSGTKINSNNAFTEATNDGKTVYAYFSENTYSITFDANGGSGEMASQTGLGCATAQTIKANSFTAPTGHHFNGWNTQADGEGTPYAAGGTVPALTVTTQGGTLKLYAQWAPNTHTLTWEWNGGSTTSTTHTPAGDVAYGTSIVYPTDASMSYAGHNFTGWDKTISTMPDADLTITAQWEVASSYTLSFAKGCEDVVTDMPESITQSTQTFTIPSTLPRRTGYTFSVWRDNNSNQYSAGEQITITGNTTLTAVWVANTNTPYVVNHKRQALDGTYPVELTETENKTGTTATAADLTTKNYTGFTTPATQEATILADGSLVVDYEYERQSFILTWNLNGGTAGTGTITSAGSTKYETVLQYTVDPTRTGYTFTGWNPEMTSGTTTMPAANTTYSAQWQAKTYTISFNQNGGTGGQTGTVTATYDQPMPKLNDFTAPTRVGYKFNGYWDAASNGTKYYNADGTSAKAWNKDANTTLYAQWTQLNVYIEGRFSVATNHDRKTWLHTGSNVDDWNVSSTNIKLNWDGTNNRYYLNTWATIKELSDEHTGPQYFNFKQCEGTSIANATEYNYGHTLTEPGVHVTMTKGGESARARFNTQEQNGYVILYFNETEMWYEIQPFEGGLFDVEFSNGGGGGTVTPSGTKKTGEVSWEVTVNPNEGYSFAGWTLTGGAKAKENDEELKTFYTIHVTATGDGKAIANFKIKPKLYFQTNDAFSNKAKVYAYFYKNEYFLENTETGGTGSKKDWGCISGPHEMQPLGHDNIYYMYYDIEYLRSQGMDSHIAFTKDSKDNADRFYETNVVYRGDFYPCDQPLFVVTDYDKTYNKSGYYKGYWSKMDGDEPEDYLMMQSENWKPNENMRFKKDNDGNWIVIKNYSGFANDYHDEFRIWRNCDGNWYGCGQTDSHNQNITSDISGWKLYTGTSNIDITPWKEGDYEFKWNPNSQELSVTYLGDITVANFPGEVSTFVNRQHKIKPDVTLRNGTTVNDVTITVNDHTLPWTSTHATYEQNGTNLVITGNAIGSETVTVRYQNNKQEPYIVDRALKVNVATPIVIQATLDGKSATEDDDYWSNTGLVHIHFWGSDATKTQDMDMSYNKDTKVFSVTAPKIDGFSFMFWYGEDINQSASEAWRKTQDIDDCTTNTCYSISYGTDKDIKRIATPKDGGGLCTTDEYYVEITMKNGNTYKSNTIDELTDLVSFFAPQDGVTDYTGGTVRIVHNGAVSEPITGFTTAGVYVAQIADANNFVANSIKPYTGKYYIRTDGAAGGWNEYKNADNELVEFTRRANKNESYSYYWVKNLAKSDKTNVKADVANDYNDNLAGMIENDKFTDGGGFIYQSSNGANVRFSYEPTTNEFKRAIIGGSSDNNFLNIYSKDAGRLYADKDGSEELNENADLLLSKFNDVSDWVYEKVVYAKADGSHPTNVILKSVFNGQTTHLLGYNKNDKGEDTDDPKPLEVLGEHTNTGTYALRISYDYKRNRLMASWEPGSMEISSNQVIDADVLFIQKENNGLIDNVDVAQITYTQAGIDADAKLTSLKNIMYILEITPNVITDTQADNQLYWFSLPFNCNINDIFGVEDYVTLDANGRATKGTWGIQRYDGATRASHGWFQDDNPEGFWRWMKRNETLVAGTGYVLVFDKTNANSWKSIGVEEPCEEDDPACVDGKKTVQQKIKRLYFPSIGTSFEISYSGESSSVTYTDNPCNVEKRREYDGNWKVIGPKSYNNIGVDNTKPDNLTFYYTYDQAEEKGYRYVEKTIIGETNNELKSFHSYMTQFGGTLTWKPFTKSSEVVKAPHYTENPEFQGGMLTIELRNAKGEELNHTFINLSKNGTTGFDQNLDLTKITENCAQIASVSEDVLYAGNTLPLDIEMVPLNVKVVADGTYDIALEQSLEGLEVRLYDAFEQTTTPLDLMSATVTLDKGEYKDRFFLQFVQKSPLTPTNFNGAIEQFNLPTDKTQKLLINSNIYLINGGRIYNATGAELR